MASAEALDSLVQLVHRHGQRCPHPPTLRQQNDAGKAASDRCPGQRRRPARKPKLGGPENGLSSSSGAGLAGSPEALDGELWCLSYVCQSGHAFSWSPETQGGSAGEGEGGGAGAALTADPPRKQGQRQGSKAVREGPRAVEEGSSVMRTRSRSGTQRTETRCLTQTETRTQSRCLTVQSAIGGSGGQEDFEEEERSAPSAGTESTQGEERAYSAVFQVCVCAVR